MRIGISYRSIPVAAGILLWSIYMACPPCRVCLGKAKLDIEDQISLEQLKLPKPEEDEGAPIYIQADSLTYLRSEDRYLAEGDVEITRGRMTLKADKVVLDNKTRLARAEGHVEVIQKDGSHLWSDQLELNIDDKTGKIWKGTLVFRRHNLTVYGDEIERLSEDQYRMKGATLTTCSGDTPDWRFTAKEVELTLEGTAKIKHATFDIRKLPVAYLPYFVYPTKTERQTGFLLPSFRSNDHVGHGVSLPFYWAFHQSWDATLTQTYYTESGYQQGVELRYAPSENLEGIIQGEYIRDQADFEEDENFRGDQSRMERNRWRFRMAQALDIPWGINSKIGVDVVSDNYYLEDFYADDDEREMRYLISTINATKRTNDYLIAGEAESYRDLDAPMDDNSLTPAKLPSLLFHRSETRIIDLPVAMGWDLTFDHIWREAGQRERLLGLAPSVSIPLSLGPYLSFVPFVEWMENISFVHSNGQEEELGRPVGNQEELDGFARLANYHYGASVVSAELGRSFPVGWKAMDSIKHTMQAEVRFDGFGSMGDDLLEGSLEPFEEKKIVPEDFPEPFEEGKFVSLDMVQFLNAQLIDEEGSVTSRESARLTITQSYKTEGDELDQPFLPLHANLDLRLVQGVAGRYDFFLEFDGFYDWYEGILEDIAVTFRGRDEPGNRLNIVYELDEELKSNLRVVSIPYVDVGMNGWYDFMENRWVRYGYGLTFHAGCWAVNFSHTIRPGFLDTETDHLIHGKIFLKGLGPLFTF